MFCHASVVVVVVGVVVVAYALISEVIRLRIKHVFVSSSVGEKGRC